MVKSILFFFSQTHCPYENLSIENSLLLNVKKDQKIYFFYRNTPSIVMGRFQNPWKECDLKRVLFGSEKIHLVRRQSGGGTVYHDMGNLNFCIIDGARSLFKDENHDLIIEALSELGITAIKSDRSDLIVHFNGPQKISGSAFKQKKDSSFHHGTLLIDSKLDTLNGLLKSKHNITKTKSISSVSSPVINLKDLRDDLTVNMFEQKILEVVYRKFDLKLEPQSLEFPVGIIAGDNSLIDKRYVEMLRSWDWLIGETPWFELQSDHEDGLHICVESKKGIIDNFRVHTDDKLNNEISNLLSSHMIGLRMEKTLLDEVFVHLFNHCDKRDSLEKSMYDNLLLKIKNKILDLNLFI